MGNTSRSVENSGAEADLNYGGLAQEVSEEKFSMWWLRDHSYNILVNNVPAVCPCLKNLPEAKLKSLD